MRRNSDQCFTRMAYLGKNSMRPALPKPHSWSDSVAERAHVRETRLEPALRGGLKTVSVNVVQAAKLISRKKQALQSVVAELIPFTVDTEIATRGFEALFGCLGPTRFTLRPLLGLA